MLEEAKDIAMRQVVGFGAIFAVIVLLGHNDWPDNFGPTRTAVTGEVSEDDRESYMDMSDPPAPSAEEVEFCRNNRQKFDEDFTTGGGEEGAHCRLLLEELPCDSDDCPDNPYEDVWDSEEWPPEVTINGI